MVQLRLTIYELVTSLEKFTIYDSRKSRFLFAHPCHVPILAGGKGLFGVGPRSLAPSLPWTLFEHNWLHLLRQLRHGHHLFSGAFSRHTQDPIRCDFDKSRGWIGLNVHTFPLKHHFSIKLVATNLWGMPLSIFSFLIFYLFLNPGQRTLFRTKKKRWCVLKARAHRSSTTQTQGSLLKEAISLDCRMCEECRAFRLCRLSLSASTKF